MTFPLPDAALDDRLSFVGTAGSGKTYNAMGRVERLLARHNRVVIPDPLGVWWGLRLNADGKSPSSYDVVIFGGPHGDLPLTEHAGALIGETVAGMKESCILDLSQLGTKAAERRFMLAFLTALYRNTAGEPLHVVFDECDMWAPQKLLDKEGEAAKLLGMMETLVRRGRVKGFIPWLITQRPAVISKDILSQVDGMVAFKLTGAHDRNAIGAWVEGQADRDQWKAIDARLPTMERGQGVVWLPGRGILDTVQFPAKATFDSSRTPKRGEKTAHADLQPLDLGKLKDRLATVDAEVKANDPAALRKRIRELEADIAKKPGSQLGPSPEALRAEYERGFSDGRILFHRNAREQLDAFVKAAASAGEEFRKRFEQVFQRTPDTAFPPAPAPSAARLTSPPPRRMNGQQAEALIRGERIILTVLAQYAPAALDRSRLGAVAGFASKGGSFRTYVGHLKTLGFIERDALRITAAGLDALGEFTPLPTGPALLEHWCARLVKGEREILQTVAGHGGQATREQIGDATGFEPSGGSFRTYVGKLKTLGLLTGSNPLLLHEDLR